MLLSSKYNFLLYRFYQTILLRLSSVYRNGDPLTLPVKILLVKPILQNWEVVLDEITRKVSLNNTAVLKYLYIQLDLFLILKYL
jgi:hypothetical protein